MVSGLLALVLCAAADSTMVPADSLASASAPVVTDSVAMPAAPAQVAVAAPDSARDSVASPALPAPVADSASAPAPAVAPEPPAAPVADAPAGPVIAPPPPPAPGPVVPFGPVQATSFGPTGAVVSMDTSGSGGRRSTSVAVGLSLLLPGTGHRYAGFKGPQPFYHAVDLLGWTALFVSWRTGRASLSNAAEIANRYAGASLGSDPDAALLSAMRNYRSRRPVAGRHDSYDEAQILSGRSTTVEFADDASHDWDWGATDNPDNNAHLRSFESQYRKWRASQVAIYSAAGTLAVLRLVAAMDVLRLQRSSILNAGLSLEASPSPEGVQAALSWKF